MDKKITATAAVGVKVTGLGVLSWPLSFRGPYGDKSECKENSGQQETG